MKLRIIYSYWSTFIYYFYYCSQTIDSVFIDNVNYLLTDEITFNLYENETEKTQRRPLRRYKCIEDYTVTSVANDIHRLTLNDEKISIKNYKSLPEKIETTLKPHRLLSEIPTLSLVNITKINIQPFDNITLSTTTIEPTTNYTQSTSNITTTIARPIELIDSELPYPTTVSIENQIDVNATTTSSIDVSSVTVENKNEIAKKNWTKILYEKFRTKKKWKTRSYGNFRSSNNQQKVYHTEQQPQHVPIAGGYYQAINNDFYGGIRSTIEQQSPITEDNSNRVVNHQTYAIEQPPIVDGGVNHQTYAVVSRRNRNYNQSKMRSIGGWTHARMNSIDAPPTTVYYEEKVTSSAPPSTYDGRWNTIDYDQLLSNEDDIKQPAMQVFVGNHEITNNVDGASSISEQSIFPFGRPSTFRNQILKRLQQQIQNPTEHVDKTRNSDGSEGASGFCATISQLATRFQIKDLRGWIHNNCDLAKLFFPSATCEQIGVYVHSCSVPQ